MKKFISFEKIGTSSSGKTNIYSVFNEQNGAVLGSISWYNSFRKYCFFPDSDTLFDSTCLIDISDFMISEMIDHKDKKDDPNAKT